VRIGDADKQVKSGTSNLVSDAGQNLAKVRIG